MSWRAAVVKASLLLAAVAVLAQHAAATTVTIHTEDARAVLAAMQNPSLSHEEALRIARMHGNQAALRKLHEFHLPATTENFANALYAAAHGLPVTDPLEKDILLDLVKPKIPQLLALLAEMEANPATFQKAIEQRVAMYAPPGADLHLEGYVIAAGDGGGYAFGDTDFFLNLVMVDDLMVARETTTHELYHAVQGAFAADRERRAGGNETPACANVERLFASLYEEGSAMEVGDTSLLRKSHSPTAKRMLDDLDEGMAHLKNSATLLEMSVAALNASEPVAYDDMYPVDFLGHGDLYNIAYGMAKAIVAQDGPQGLAVFLKQPPYRFLLRYTQLTSYGSDKDHPRLGPNTIAAANRLAGGCK